MKKLLLVFALLGWLLAACASPPTPAPTALPPTLPAQPQPPATQAQPTDARPVAPISSAAPTPTLRADFEATDPASVVLAAGQPQLVEFFAFW